MKFSFFSTCDEIWGGSEELWSAVATQLAGLGHMVRAYKTRVAYDHPKVARLTACGCLLSELHNPNYPLAIRILNRILSNRWRYRPEGGELAFMVKGHLRSFQPHLTVVSQGENFDGVHLRIATSPRGNWACL